VTFPIVQSGIEGFRHVGTGVAAAKVNSLLQNMYFCNEAECGDPRDRIYALLSISYNADDFELDYACDTESVYYDAAKRIVESNTADHLVLLLASATIHKCRLSTRTLPSWVPDWRRPITHVSQAHETCVATCFFLPDKVSLVYSPLQKAGYSTSQKAGDMPSYVFLLACTTKTRILSNVNRVYHLTVVNIAF
jgi:hypothetical protein